MRGIRLSGLEWALILLAALPIGVLIVFVARYGYTVPWLDEYVNMVPLVLKQQAGTLTLGDLFVQYGDHRLPIPYGISVLFAALSGGDMRWELAFSILLMLLSFALLVDLYRRRSSSRTETLVFAALAAFLLFSLGQRQNWVWGNQKCMFLMMFGTYLSAWALARFPGSWRALWICLAGTLIAAWSFLGGNVLWVLIPIAMWLNGVRSWRMYALWLLLAGICIALYANGYRRDSMMYSSGSIGGIADSFRYMLSFMGNGLSNATTHLLEQFNGSERYFSLGMPLLMGMLGLILLGVNLGAWLYVRRIATRDLSPFLLLAGFTGANGLLLIVGRGEISSALSAHYITLTVPFWIAVTAFTIENIASFIKNKSLQLRWRSFIPLTVVISCLLIAGYIANTHRALTMRETYNAVMEQCALTRLQADERCLIPRFLLHESIQPDQAIALLDQLEAERLFLFR